MIWQHFYESKALVSSMSLRICAIGGSLFLELRTFTNKE